MLPCLCPLDHHPYCLVSPSFQAVLQSFLWENTIPAHFQGLGAWLPYCLQRLQPGEHNHPPVSAAQSELEGQEGLCLVPQLTAAHACVVCAMDAGCLQRRDMPWEQGGRPSLCAWPCSLGTLCVRCLTVPSLPTQDWGMEMLYRQVKLPILCIKNFVVETPAEKRRYKKWSAVTFPIKAFDYLEYCADTHGLSF